MSISAIGPRPLNDLYTSNNTLKSILNLTGSQCKDLRTGVMFICSGSAQRSVYYANISLSVYPEVYRSPPDPGHIQI